VEQNVSMPEFRPIEKSDRGIFLQAFKNYPPDISEYTFTNLFAWRNYYRFEFGIVSGYILVRAFIRDAFVFLPPIGPGNEGAFLKKVIIETGSPFIRVPEPLALMLKSESGLIVTADPDNSDYLFNVQDLILLAGRKYDGKRNLIHKFKSSYNYEYSSFEGMFPRICLDFADEWCVMKDCEGEEGLKREREAVGEMCDSFNEFSLLGGAIRVSGKIKAIALGERLNHNTLVMHVLKADPSIQGLYQTMFNEFLLREVRSFEYVNMEQDLGIEGLRKAKRSYQPVAMVNKYTIWPPS